MPASGRAGGLQGGGPFTPMKPLPSTHAVKAFDFNINGPVEHYAVMSLPIRIYLTNQIRSGHF